MGFVRVGLNLAGATAADTSSIAWLLHGLSVAMTARGHTTLTPSVMASASSCMPVSVIMLDRKSHLRAGSVKSCALHTISARCASLTRVAFQIQDLSPARSKPTQPSLCKLESWRSRAWMDEFENVQRCVCTWVRMSLSHRSETKLIGGVRRFATATKDCTELPNLGFETTDQSHAHLDRGRQQQASRRRGFESRCCYWSRASGAVCASQWTPVRCTNPSTRRAGMAPALNTCSEVGENEVMNC